MVISSAHYRSDGRAMKTTTDKWRIDRFPWRCGDEYMYWYEHTIWMITDTGMATQEAEKLVETGIEMVSRMEMGSGIGMGWCRNWSCRRLFAGLRTER